jgi:hypothetical protein
MAWPELLETRPQAAGFGNCARCSCGNPLCRWDEDDRFFSWVWAIAEHELRAALTIPEPKLVQAKRILVYDDVYTEGLTLPTVARALREAGAREVSEIVLARQPYRGG